MFDVLANAAEKMANETISTSFWIPLLMDDGFLRLNSSPWLYAFVCSTVVGLSGLVPVLLIQKASEKSLRFMLAFGCGGLLGDVFLHLLPEAYKADCRLNGLWILAGILTFVVLEKALNFESENEKVNGYLNLMANCVDNFAHGLAVGGAFLVDTRTGFLTTAVILCHEIPHEIGDFAILVSSGFSVNEAAKAQASTAAVGVLGAMLALTLDEVKDSLTSWILPFTCGGFLHVALVAVLPDLLKKTQSQPLGDALRVLVGIALGVGATQAVNAVDFL